MKMKKRGSYVEEATRQVRKHDSDDLKRLRIGNKKFQQDVQDLRQRFGIPPSGYEMYLPISDVEKIKSKYISTVPNPIRGKFQKKKNKAWAEAVNVLLVKYNLSLKLYNVMDLYLFSNDTRYFEPDFFLLPSGNARVAMQFYDTAQGPKMRREIVITSHLTEKEYKALKTLQNDVFGKRKRRRVRKNIDRDIEIAEKSQRKGKGEYKSDREIADHITAFQNEGEDVESLRGLSRKQANVIKQARYRLRRTKIK